MGFILSDKFLILLSWAPDDIHSFSSWAFVVWNSWGFLRHSNSCCGLFVRGTPTEVHSRFDHLGILVPLGSLYWGSFSCRTSVVVLSSGSFFTDAQSLRKHGLLFVPQGIGCWMFFHSLVDTGGGPPSCNLFTRALVTFDCGWICFPSVDTHWGSSSPGIWWRFVLPVNTSCLFHGIHGFSSVSRECWEASFFRENICWFSFFLCSSVDVLWACVQLWFSLHGNICQMFLVLDFPRRSFWGAGRQWWTPGTFSGRYHIILFTVSPSGFTKGREISFPIHTFWPFYRPLLGLQRRGGGRFVVSQSLVSGMIFVPGRVFWG